MALPNHPVNTLAGIALPRGVAWQNRFEYPVIGQKLVRMLDGSLDQYVQANHGVGQPITLLITLPLCYFTKAQYDAMQAKADVAGATYTFTWGYYAGSWTTTDYGVIFDFQNGAAVNVIGQNRFVYSAGKRIDIYTGQINLLRVS